MAGFANIPAERGPEGGIVSRSEIRLASFSLTRAMAGRARGYASEARSIPVIANEKLTMPSTNVTLVADFRE
jgi:hypothetical protein